MTESISTDLIVMLMEDFDISMRSAFDSLYNSETYAKLTDATTGLYFQSSGYVYSYLKREITTGTLETTN
ncbi:MAG: hypothetical protein J6Q34_02345 [Bacteroidales bacterium]|nr:hypothetical protein [Bacteroidales bacterium]